MIKRIATGNALQTKANNMNTIEYLDLIKSTKSITSDYKLSKLLGISRSRLSHYRNGRNTMDELLALKVEKILNLKPGTVLIDLQAERSKCPEARAILHELAQKLAATALTLVLVFSGVFLPNIAEAGQFGRFDNNIHYAYLCICVLINAFSYKYH